MKSDRTYDEVIAFLGNNSEEEKSSRRNTPNEKRSRKIKEIIDNNGPDYLSEEPYKVSDKKASVKQRLLERQRQVDSNLRRRNQNQNTKSGNYKSTLTIILRWSGLFCYLSKDCISFMSFQILHPISDSSDSLSLANFEALITASSICGRYFSLNASPFFP